MKIFPYLVLARPANVVTAVADVIAGIAIVGVFNDAAWIDSIGDMMLLVLSTMGLYAGGVVLNDFFDADLDAVERPERPIPSGKVSKQSALVFGLVLTITGIVCALLSSTLSGMVALGIGLLAILYDYKGKHHPFWGPLNMGLCRGLNLLLGMTVVSMVFETNLWMMSVLPVVFVAAITLTSRGEVEGNNRVAVSFALFLDMFVAITLVVLGLLEVLDLWTLAPFLALWLGMNLRAKWRAISDNRPENIKNAVKTGVVSLIPLNAAYAAAFGNWIIGGIVLIMLPLASLLAKKFAVT